MLKEMPIFPMANHKFNNIKISKTISINKFLNNYKALQLVTVQRDQLLAMLQQRNNVHYNNKIKIKTLLTPK